MKKGKDCEECGSSMNFRRKLTGGREEWFCPHCGPKTLTVQE